MSWWMISILIGLLGLLIAAFPVLVVVIGGLLGFGADDPSWGGAWSFMPILTIPAGIVVAVVGWLIQAAVVWVYSMWG